VGTLDQLDLSCAYYRELKRDINTFKNAIEDCKNFSLLCLNERSKQYEERLKQLKEVEGLFTW